MKVDKKILEEISRYKKMNNYILEQDLGAVPPPPPADPAAGAVPPPPGGDPAAPPPTAEAGPQKIDVESDPDVEKIDSKGKSENEEGSSEDTEELDITDLVDAQNKVGEKQESYFDQLFNQLSNLEQKLSEMDSLMNRLNSIENKIEKYRNKTPEERLELRTYDSAPYNQKLSQFFDEKEEEMELTGKNDYVLTPDQVTDINPSEIKDSFMPPPKNVKDFGY